MKVTIETGPNEKATLVLETQERQAEETMLFLELDGKSILEMPVNCAKS